VTIKTNVVAIAENQKNVGDVIGSQLDTIKFKGIEIDRADYENAVKQWGKDVIEAHPWLVEFSNNSEITKSEAKENWAELVRERDERILAEGATATQSVPSASIENVSAIQPAPPTPHETIEANGISSNDLSSKILKESVVNSETLISENRKNSSSATQETVMAKGEEHFEKFKEILPRAILEGIAAYFDNAELRLKNIKEKDDSFIIADVSAGTIGENNTNA